MEDKAYQRQQRTIIIEGCQDVGGPGATIGATISETTHRRENAVKHQGA